MTDPKYGIRNVPKMIREIEQLRQSIRAEGTPAIQEAWEKVEQHIDYAYRLEVTEIADKITRNAVEEIIKALCSKIVEEKAIKPFLKFRASVLQEAAAEGYKVCAETRHMTLATKVEKAIMALNKGHSDEKESYTFPRAD